MPARQQPQEVAGTEQYPERYELRLPIDHPDTAFGSPDDVGRGHLVEVLTSPDPRMAGRSFTVHTPVGHGRRVNARFELHASPRGPRL